MREIKRQAGQISFAPDTELKRKILECVIQRTIPNITTPVNDRPDLELHYRLKGHMGDDRFTGSTCAKYCGSSESMESTSLPVTFRVGASQQGEIGVMCDRIIIPDSWKADLPNHKAPGDETMTTKTNATRTYHADIHVRKGGDTAFEVDSIESVLSQTVKWAAEDSWLATGCEVDVHVWSEDENGEIVEELRDIVEIPSTTKEEDSDSEVIAMCEGEHSTRQIILMESEAYYMHYHNQQEHPVELTRRITRSEARALMLDWGYTPTKVTKVTRRID